MQHHTNVNLAAYLVSPHSVLDHELKIDWDNTGFTNTYSDMSEIYEDLQIERHLKGDIPDDLNAVEGYSVAELKITLGGRRSQDTLDIHALIMSPASPLVGTADPIGLGCAITYRVIVPLSGTPLVIDQFVGIIRTVDPQLDGTVKITALDLMDLLSRTVSLYPIAVDYMRILASPTLLAAERQKFNLTWALDQVLRQCGLFCSPAVVTNSATKKSYFCATLNGTWFPDPGLENPIYSTVTSVVQPPDLPFIAGLYGFAANGTTGSFGQYNFLRISANWIKGETHQMGGYVFGPRAIQSGTTTCICDVTLSGDPDLAGRCQMQLFLSTTGVVTARLVQLTGQTYDVTFTGPTITGGAAWHYVAVGLEWRTSNSGVTAWYNVDGVVTSVVNATVLLAFTVFKNYATVRLQSKMPTQHVQWWKNISGSLIWTRDLPVSTTGVSPQTSLELAMSNLTAIPDVYQTKGLEVVKDMMSAELGVLYSTESGLIKFMTRDSVNSSRSPAHSITLTEDDLSGLVVHLRKDSFVNSIVTESSLLLLLPVVAYKSDLAERFDTVASTTGIFHILLDDIHNLSVFFSVPFVNPWPAGGTGISSGFHVIKVSDGTIPSGVFVSVIMRDQRKLEIQVINTSAFTVRLSSAGEPALHVPGYGISVFSEQRSVLENASSIALRGTQSLTLSRNDWRTHAASVDAIGASLLADVAIPTAVIEPVEVRSDPRIQLNDLVYINTDKMGQLETSIIGYTRRVTRGAYPVDTYTLRVL